MASPSSENDTSKKGRTCSTSVAVGTSMMCVPPVKSTMRTRGAFGPHGGLAAIGRDGNLDVGHKALERRTPCFATLRNIESRKHDLCLVVAKRAAKQQCVAIR